MEPRARQSIDYHGALAPLAAACALADVVCVADLLAPAAGAPPALRRISIALRHLGLVATAYRNRRRQGLLVRDFSNVPLMCVFPLVRRMADRMFFVVNHNLQWTVDNPAERTAFRRLGRWGCRFAFFEQVPLEKLKAYGIDPARSFAIPHPVPSTDVRRERAGGVRTVGIIGQYRPEKGIDELLERLKPLAGRYRVVAAIPNIEAFRRRSAFASADWFELVGTGTSEAYRRAIAGCDAVLLSHPATGYEYRASGLVADAAAAAVPVVARGLPVLRHQVEWPVPVGECFGDLSELETCLRTVDRKLAGGGYDFESYNKARSAAELAKTIDAICSQRTTA